MKTSKWFAITVAAAISAGGLFVLNAHAAESAAPRAAMRGRLLERAKEKLGLTDGQIARIKAVLKADKDSLTELLTRLHEARSGLRGAIQSSDATEASVRTASAKVAAVEADLAVERLKLYGKINPILTADQREKLGELQARMDDLADAFISSIGERLAE